jgi:hypothetical protein
MPEHREGSEYGARFREGRQGQVAGGFLVGAADPAVPQVVEQAAQRRVFDLLVDNPGPRAGAQQQHGYVRVRNAELLKPHYPGYF